MVGGYVEAVAKMGTINVADKRYDICDNLNEGGILCPLGPGDFLLERKVVVPKQAALKPFDVEFRGWMDEGKPLGCLNGKVDFTAAGRRRIEL